MNETEQKIQIKRIGRFSDRLSKTVLLNPVPFQLQFAQSDGETGFKERTQLEYQPISTGDQWGQRWEVGWFKCLAQIPESYRSHTLVARIDLGGEGLVYDHTGNMLQGISSGSVFESDFSRDMIHFRDIPDNHNQLELWIEASACGLFGLFTDPEPTQSSPNRYGHFDARVKCAELCCFDKDRYHLWLDVETVRGMLSVLPESSTRRARLLVAAAGTVDLFEQGAAAPDCRDRLFDELNRPASASELTVTAIGHAHIDTAWLWPIRESMRKCARTFASQLDLIEKYPDYRFGASQPQHYQFVKEQFPDLYERICNAVKNGRWEVQGGMWVEADCNLISGESIVRQILHGKNFFRDEFGVDVNNLWLPDVFGYSPALPQILFKSGMPYFLTQKMSWNQYNKFPHHTFNWQGIDGSRVLAHFPPEDTYNSSLRAESLMRGAAQFHERGYVDRFISLFGVGDGGGGPKEEHIEFGLRCQNTESVPRVQFDSATNFFAQIEPYRNMLPVWSGELYLELHRGTLTTQARNKRWNRKLEYRLQDTEMLFSCLNLTGYPSESLDKLWKTVLKNQFHDILPGSSIRSVYEQTEREYQGVSRAIDEFQRRAIESLTNSDENALVVFNPSSHKFTGVIALPSGWSSASVAGLDSSTISTQSEENGTLALISIEPGRFMNLTMCEPESADIGEDTQRVLENELVKYEFDNDGCLLRAYDKECRRVVTMPDAPGNQLTLYEDRPNDWDAWDIDRTYEQSSVDSQRMAEPPRRISGPVRQTLSLKLEIGNSSIQQTISLTQGSKRLDFDTKIDWQESHRMLRVAFPVDVHAQEASFDIQFGYIKRPTHRNTSWDLARFETVGHRFADISEPDYGVALLNDCKYGYKVLGNTLDLCLLRSPSYPDPDADSGEHRFTYSLLPHEGDFVRSDLLSQASALNHPPLVFAGGSSKVLRLPVWIEGPGVSLETLKKGEKEDCLIVRLVETDGRRSNVTLRHDSSIVRIEECDLMEWHNIGTLDPKSSNVIMFSPFEIKTFKLWRE